MITVFFPSISKSKENLYGLVHNYFQLLKVLVSYIIWFNVPLRRVFCICH